MYMYSEPKNQLNISTIYDHQLQLGTIRINIYKRHHYYHINRNSGIAIHYEGSQRSNKACISKIIPRAGIIS